MLRSPDVFDVWFDSAVASWATLRFPSHEEEFGEWWPRISSPRGTTDTRLVLPSWGLQWYHLAGRPTRAFSCMASP